MGQLRGVREEVMKGQKLKILEPQGQECEGDDVRNSFDLREEHVLCSSPQNERVHDARKLKKAKIRLRRFLGRQD